MGLFCIPPKPKADCSVEDLVGTAAANINLWKRNQSCDYLLEMAIGFLEDALKKHQDINNVN